MTQTEIRMTQPEPTTTASQRAARRPALQLGALGLYTVLALILSWPLAARITTHVPGVAQWAFDESTFLWNIWYLKWTAVDQLSNPLHSELIWYPLGIDLILYTYNIYHALFALPLALAFNLAVGSNIAILASTVLSGYGTFLLVLYLLSARPAQAGIARASQPWIPALLAGLIYAFASNRSVYATLGHYDMTTTQWIPFYALALWHSLEPTRRLQSRARAAALAGFFFAATGLAEMISALFLAIFTLIVVAVRIRDLLRAAPPAPPRSAQASTLLFALAINGLVACAIWSPLLLPILRQFLTSDFALQGWGEAIPLSTDLLGWFQATVLHPVFGGDLVTELRRVQLRALEQGVRGLRDINTVFLGWTSLALALVGALAFGGRRRVWIWTSVLFGLFTLGPFLQIGGEYRFDLDGVETSFPMPYALLHYLPIIKANRAPNRNSVMLMLGIAVLAGFGARWLLLHLEQWARTARVKTALGRGAALLLGALLIFEHLALPLPLSDARVPAVYTEIGADPRPVSVMNLPLGWRNSFGTFGPERTLLQYYQTAHAKPMLGGNISRAPDFKMDYFRRIPYFRALVDISSGQPVDDELLAAARSQVDELFYLYNVGYVLLHPPIPQRFPYADHWQAAWAFVKETAPLEELPFWQGEGIEAYRVQQPEGMDRFQLALGEPGTFPYRGEGWDEAEVDTPYGLPAVWATEPTSRLFIPLRNVDRVGTYTLQVQTHPFAYPGNPVQQLLPRVNGQPLASQPLADSWQTLAWQLPGELLVDGLNRIELGWAELATPRVVIGGNRQIGTTGVELPVDVDLKAFADGAFMALFAEDGRQTDASAGRHGVNVTVLERQSGVVSAQVGFDTTANRFESDALAQFLSTIPPGQPVLVASRGLAGTHLTAEAVAQLRTLGADLTLDQLQQGYFAIIGVKGAETGSAAVDMGPEEAFLRVSLVRDRRPLAAAVGQVSVGPATAAP